jgi:hypothetical protein
MDKLKLPEGLRRNILLSIARSEYLRARNYLFVFAIIVSTSLVGLVLSAQYFLQSFYQSGFYQYMSLIFSGDTAVFTYWKELSYSLIETVPIIGIIAFFTALCFFVWSGAHTVTSVRRLTLASN